ncbi:hypothetical protein [Streptomyces mirabilis]|uniref:hypothetical protein n=1 Tax=Streptomyces mirabilis TaxID=68239 RepID=UPI0036539CF0
MASGWLGLDWGNVPSWCGAVVTSTSASVAALSYRKSVRDKEMDQASKVAAWIGMKEESDRQVFHLLINNSSNAPIYEISVKVSARTRIILQSLAAGGIYETEVPSDEIPRESSKKSVTIAIGSLVEATWESEETKEVPLEVFFRDSLGRWWERKADGRLRRSSNPRREDGSFRN